MTELAFLKILKNGKRVLASFEKHFSKRSQTCRIPVELPFSCNLSIISTLIWAPSMSCVQLVLLADSYDFEERYLEAS